MPRRVLGAAQSKCLQGAKRKLLDGARQSHWTATSLLYFRATRSRQPHFIVHQPRRTRRQISMAIDEPGHYDTAAGINLLGVARQRQIFDTAAGANFANLAAGYQHRAILDESQIPEVGSAARAARSP